MLLGFVIIGNCPGKIDIRRIRRLKYGYVKFFLWDGKPFRRSQQFPGVGNGFLLEVIAEGEIAKHLEERVVALGEADVFEVVVLAARAHAFLCGGRAGVIAFFEAQEHVLELVHPRIREQQGRVTMRHERRAAHAAVPLALEEAQERLADLIATPRLGVFPCAPYRGRFLFAGHTGLIGWSGRMHGLSQSLTVAAIAARWRWDGIFGGVARRHQSSLSLCPLIFSPALTSSLLITSRFTFASFQVFLKLSLTKYATLVQYDSGRIAKFGVRQPGCRIFYFMGVQIIAYSPDCPSLESMTYELQILQLLCFDIHTNCRGCVPHLYIVFVTALPPIQEGSVSELVSISGRFWLRVKERSSRRIMSAGKPARRRLR